MDRQTYMKAYRATYKERVKVIKIAAELSLFAKLDRLAKAEGTKPATMAREIITSWLDRRVLVPTALDRELKEHNRLLRNIANNINQIAHHSNAVKKLVQDQQLFAELRRLEKLMSNIVAGRL